MLISIEPVLSALDAVGARYALIGGQALAARGYPRFTVDVDLLTTSPRVLEAETWVRLERDGATVERRRGDLNDPLAGVVHILLADATDVDLVLAKWPWEADILDRAEVLAVSDTLRMRVVRTADLILLKLAAGGLLDIHDAAVLLHADRHRLSQEVESRLGEIRPPVNEAWQRVLSVEIH